MKIVHTADWHLGKLVQGVYLTEDQRDWLRKFCDEMEKEQPDVIILAGDIYDRAIPPAEAIQLFHETVEYLVLQLAIPVLAIAGNHDSPTRLQFGNQLMKERGFHIAGRCTNPVEKVTFHDEIGPVHFYLVPYAEPSAVATAFQKESIRTHAEATEAIIDACCVDSTERSIYVGHAFVTSGGKREDNTSDAERPLAIGGTEQVASELFQAFDYVALGHLHQAHYVERETIRYAGSPLKYSISEEHHVKGYTLVHLEETCRIEKRVIHPRREMRTVTGTMDELLVLPPSDDYVFIQLTDEVPVLFPMEKIRSVFPNAMHIERKIVYRTNDQSGERTPHTTATPTQLFEAFYTQLAEQPPHAAIVELFEEIAYEVTKEEE